MNIALVDRSPLAVLGLEHGLKEKTLDINIVSIAGNFQQLEYELNHKDIDIVFIGILVADDKPFHSIKQVYQLKIRWPDIKFVLYTDIKSISVLRYLSYMKMDAILSRSDCLNNLKNNIIKISKGEFFCSNNYSGELTKSAIGRNSTNRMMTNNEIEVLDRVSLGESVSEIAVQSQRSIKTVSNHKRNAMSKLGIETDSELHLFIMNVAGKMPIYSESNEFAPS
ncbi:response regulator transcription factor [Yersinia enterocolitica]|nr:response regulator transcription factor [Yersinia enterocolitica]HEI6760551.1 response regulator transcription factor [Yersinia enterocolitica]HEI6825150.1 response regulator transcription factor [Yersinia enterocolitica]HEI6867864.1 response regulator transcription factor [Yersinia enterocolitica]